MVDTIGLALADIVLTEVIAGKLTFTSSAAELLAPAPAVKVVEFPAPTKPKKRAA